jgi:aspartyl-tRNA(Asn)/glutamyl-tRNA(Gln) amidotransferase subunit C
MAIKAPSRNELIKLSKDLFFELSESELDDLENEFSSLLEQFNRLENLDVDNLNPTSFPISNSFAVLREDEAIKNENPQELLKNSKNKKGDFIVLK